MSATERTTSNAAQKNLATRLDARDELDETLVQVGLNAKVPPERDRIYIASIDDLTRSATGPLAASPAIFHEAYTLTLMIECHRADPQARVETNDRLHAMIAALEQELADDQELAAGVVVAYVQEVPSAFTVPGTAGWIGKAIVHVHIDAQVDLG